MPGVMGLTAGGPTVVADSVPVSAIRMNRQLKNDQDGQRRELVSPSLSVSLVNLLQYLLL